MKEREEEVGKRSGEEGGRQPLISPWLLTSSTFLSDLRSTSPKTKDNEERRKRQNKDKKLKTLKEHERSEAQATEGRN